MYLPDNVYITLEDCSQLQNGLRTECLLSSIIVVWTALSCLVVLFVVSIIGLVVDGRFIEDSLPDIMISIIL